jgi:hypothetical protein
MKRHLHLILLLAVCPSALLGAGPAPDRVSLANRWVERVFQAGGTWRTLTYRPHEGDGELVSRSGLGDEGSVTADGQRLVLGGDGPDDLRLVKWSLRPAGRDRQRLRVEFAAHPPEGAGLAAVLTYDLFSEAPVLVKAIRLENRGHRALRVDAVTLESFRPTSSGGHVLLPVGATELSAPLDRVLAPGESCEFPGLECYQFVLPQGDPERYGLALRRDMRRVWPWTTRRVLAAGFRESGPPESAERLWNFARQAAEAGFRGLWIQHSGSPPVLFANFADYDLHPKVWPGGWAQVRGFTDWCHRHGMKVFFYVTHTAVWWNPGVSGPGVPENQAFRSHHWNRTDDQGRVLAPTRESPRNWTENACPASGWGAFLLGKVLEAVARGGLDGFDLDGPYDWWQSSDPSLFCWARDHGHPPGGGSRLPAWENTVRIYQEARARGLFLPTAAGWPHLAAGASRMAGSGAYEGADAATRDPWEYAWWSRRQEYDLTFQWNTAQLCKVINLTPWLGGLSLVPLEQHLELYNAQLANAFGYGFDGMPSGDVLWDGPRSKALLKEWVRFYRTHERFFADGDLLHVRRPDGVHLDAVAHVISGPRPQALVVAYNPRATSQTDTLTIPLDRLDLPSQRWRVREFGGAGRFAVLPTGRVRTTIAGRGAGWCVLDGSPRGGQRLHRGGQRY